MIPEKTNAGKPLPKYIEEYIKKHFAYNPESGTITRDDKPECLGHVNKKGYHITKVKGHPYKSHRIAWLLYYGELPQKELDHINHNKADNRLCNLRQVSSSENAYNRPVPPNRDTGCIGIHLQKGNKKYATQYKGKHYNFISLEEAIAFRESKGLKI